MKYRVLKTMFMGCLAAQWNGVSAMCGPGMLSRPAIETTFDSDTHKDEMPRRSALNFRRTSFQGSKTPPVQSISHRRSVSVHPFVDI